VSTSGDAADTGSGYCGGALNWLCTFTYQGHLYRNPTL